MKNGRRAAGVYAAGHFLVDLACAFLLTGRVLGRVQWPAAALVYNFCAFALQMPLGLLADRLGRPRLFAAAGCVLAAAAYALGDTPVLLCATAGLGNALYHVGGGLDALNRSDGKAGPLGVFVCPGAAGLFCGGLLGRSGFPYILPAIVLLAAAAAVWRLCRGPENAPLSVRPRQGTGFAVLCLFLVVCLRSYGGFLFSFSWKTGLWAWLFTLAVVLGKALGGILADRFGSTRTAVLSLLLAAGLFLFSDIPVCGVLAVWLFNMTMPLTLRAAADAFPGAKGFSFGLLTFALFLGFLPAWLGLSGGGSPWAYAALTGASLLLLLPGLRGSRS